MRRRLWKVILLLYNIVVAVWLIYAIWAFATFRLKIPPEPAATEPYGRLIIGGEQSHALLSPCARSLHWGRSYGFLWYKFEDCEKGMMKGMLPIRNTLFYDAPPYIEFPEIE